MTVWHLIATMRIERETPDQAAKNFGLPLEAVREAVDYYTRHKDIVEADTAEEKRILVEEFGLKESQTDWERVKNMTELEIEAGAASDTDGQPTDAAFWENAQVVMPQRKRAISLHVDSDVLEWFKKSHGRGYQTRMNAALREYMEAQQR
jgi:uncharacterized protein (DUF4415 family)